VADFAVDSFVASPNAERVVVDAGAAGVWIWTRDGYRRLNAADPVSFAVTA
jgi:sugar/nucleoside kinase (ribokinase family)